MDKFTDWITSKFKHPLSPMFFFLGVLLVLLGVSNGISLPVFNQLASNPNFRWACLVLGVLCFIASVFIFYSPPKVDDGSKYQVHKYSGTWTVHTTFSRWRDQPIQEPDRVSFDGKALLVIQNNGEGGSGVQIGKLNVRVGNYSATYDILNEVQRAFFDPSGTLIMQVQVIRRELLHDLPPKPDRGKDPYANLRGELVNRSFRVELVVPDTASQDRSIQLEGRHTHEEGQVDQIAREKYTYAGLFNPPGLTP